MIIVLNTEEAKKWAEENLYEADSFIDPLKVAVERKKLLPIPGSDNKFLVAEGTESQGFEWHIRKVIRLTDEEMEMRNLYCRYRYCQEYTKTPKSYIGPKVMEAGFTILDERDNRLSLLLKTN